MCDLPSSIHHTKRDADASLPRIDSQSSRRYNVSMFKKTQLRKALPVGCLHAIIFANLFSGL